MLLWRLDCKHVDLDGAMVFFGLSEAGLLIRAQLLQPWGWLCDVYQADVHMPQQYLPILLNQTWPHAPTAELCKLAQRDPQQIYQPSEVA